MRQKFSAAAAAIAVAAVVAIPATPANADSFRNDQWYLKALNVQEAHSITKGAGIIVGLIDTGTFPHPDVRRNILPGADFVDGESGNGRNDNAGHGTGMAALIAGHGRGSDGILGIAPSAKIVPVKTSNDKNKAPAPAIGKGIGWAVRQHVKVINVSAGVGPAFEVEDAVAAALDADIVVVASVGNTSSNGVIGYPAAIDGVLAVGALGRNGNYASLSLKDSKVQICAPGVDITTAAPENKYVNVDGTSPSAAIVSGAVALVRSKFPNLPANEIIHRITATADDIGPPGRDSECGFGRLNIVKALTADVPPLSGTTVPVTPSQTSATTPPTVVPASSSPVAAPETSSSSTPLVLGVLAGVVVAVGVVLGVAVRRRRRG